MNQLVPNWDVEETHHTLPPHRLNLRAHSNSTTTSLALDVPTLDYEVTELTWQNGQLGMQGLGLPRGKASVAASPASATKYAWEKPLPAGGTLEAVVNQATAILPGRKPKILHQNSGGDELVPWFEDPHHHHHQRPAVTTTASCSHGLTMDALVPCSNSKPGNDQEQVPHVPSPPGTCVVGVGCSATHVGSCSAATTSNARVPRVSGTTGGDQQSGSISATFGRDSRHVTVDTCDRELLTPGFTSATSLGSPENTSSAARLCTNTVDTHDSACQSRNQSVAEEEKRKGNGKSSGSNKRSRAAAIHNQSERKRRDKINQRMKTLQKLVPNSSKTDKASMLDEVIEYLKQLQAQVNLMSRMNMPSMILPLALQQQQLQMMSMMAPMGLGMNMGMAAGMGLMDLNSIGRANMAAAAAGMAAPPHVHHAGATTAFMPPTSWPDGISATSSSSTMPDPLAAAFLQACQSQPMTMDAYARMAALYQQFQQSPPGAGSTN